MTDILHLDIGPPKVGDPIILLCGARGGLFINIVEDVERVTCKRCLKSPKFSLYMLKRVEL